MIVEYSQDDRFDDDAHPCWSDSANRSDIKTVLDVLLG